MPPMSPKNNFLALVKHPVKSRLFLFYKLPSAYFAGVRIREANQRYCAVTVPYKWFSQNPFRSTYFACLSMAAEMSTGVLAMAHCSQLRPPVSMLVQHVEGHFIKKATGITTFICREGEAIQKTIDKALQSGTGEIIRTTSTGTNEAGEVIAEFFITWSFKRKS
jgi:hypothetical protein